jgi:predicted nucleotidyltransferase
MANDHRLDLVLAERLQKALNTVPLLRLAVLFGSAASGRNRTDSDVDLAILLREPDLDEPTELALARELTLAARTEVDLIRLDTASTLLKWQVATKGIALVEDLPGEFARFRARAAAEYIEYAPALAYYGEIFRRRLIESRHTR